MIKSELVQRIAEHNPHLFQRDVENIVNAILDEIIAALARGDRVELRGFGAFSVKNRPARTGRNPRTGDAGRGDGEVGAVLQDRQGNARAPEQADERTGCATATSPDAAMTCDASSSSSSSCRSPSSSSCSRSPTARSSRSRSIRSIPAIRRCA